MRVLIGRKVTPKGKSTIERINSNLEKLERREALGPTTDELFAYRVDITTGSSFLFGHTYRVEFGDFPGEQSEKLAEETEEWFHNTAYFKWVIEANAFIFIIDLAWYFKDKTEYVARVSAAIRAARQCLLENHEDRKTDLRHKPVVLVFTKADLFAEDYDKDSPGLSLTEEAIMRLGFGKPPELKEIDQTKLDQGSQRVKEDFADLIAYLDNESNKFEPIFLSSFGILNGKRLNFNELLNAILPR